MFIETLHSRAGLGNFSNRRARFTEKNSLRATLKAKSFFAVVYGRSIFGIFTLKKYLLEQLSNEINIK